MYRPYTRGTASPIEQVPHQLRSIKNDAAVVCVGRSGPPGNAKRSHTPKLSNPGNVSGYARSVRFRPSSAKHFRVPCLCIRFG